MNLIQRLKIWKELKRLEQKARMSPSPSTFIDLGQVYINLEMHEETLELAEEGLALFPQSQELRKLRRFAKKNQLAARITATKTSIERDPHPDRYQELASLHLELGDFDAVQGACEECIRRFPQDAGAHLLLGRAWLTNFYRDLRAREGAQAIEHLEKGLENGADMESVRRLLAELYWRIGADAQCKEQLAELRKAGVLDDEMEALEAAVARQPSQAVADIEALLHETETRGRLPRAPVHTRSFEGGPQGSSRAFTQAPGTTTPSSANGVREALAKLADHPGVRKATYIRGSKALVKGQIKDGRDSFLRVVRVVARSAQRAARRMDIGNFNKGVVEGSFGRICVCSFGEALAAVECSTEVDTGPILVELQELVAGSLVQSRFDTEGV